MAYVAVRENGDELMFNKRPYRGYSMGGARYWRIDAGIEHYRIELPKGSIQKLIGRELTWDDEPVELIESINDKICSECGRGQTHHKIMFFLKERAYLGTEAPQGMPPELYRKSQYDFGFDYSTSCRVKKKQCECGNEWYEKAE